MTTAHRPTFDPARGKEALRGPAYHQRLLPAHTQLKFRKRGQGGDADEPKMDLAADLLAAEAAYQAKKKGAPLPPAAAAAAAAAADDDDAADATRPAGKRALSPAADGDGDAAREEDAVAKRRKMLEETRHLDASDSDGVEDSGDDSSDEDEDAELQRELARVRREREEKKQREEAERAKEEQEARERNIALGNPLLNKQDFTMKRRWDDDVVFKNQARGTEDKGKKEFVNDLLRSDFHRRFMSRYVR